jgi:hypothetical protein
MNAFDRSVKEGTFGKPVQMIGHADTVATGESGNNEDIAAV